MSSEERGSLSVIIVGGGAAGIFASAILTEESPELRVLVLEKSARPLAKVRASGGGRCNLTHVCLDIRDFVENYPRGASELIGPFHRFGPEETAEWFEEHGVPLEARSDGCIFPRSGHSEDVVDALLKTGGDIRLNELNFKTMESQIVPGLHFAGEVLDIDALTGGYNLQAAWTTAYLAAQSLQAQQ